MLSKDDIKTETLNKYQGSRIKVFSYDELYHYIISLYKEDDALCNLLFELTGKWGEDIKNKYNSFGFIENIFCNYKAKYESEEDKITIIVITPAIK